MKTEAPPSVVCVVVNWNGWIDTVECLESLDCSDYCNLCIVVVDNGSTNDSVAHIQAQFPAVELIKSDTNLGFGAGNNLGIRRALELGAQYIWLLNNDTVVESGTLSALVDRAETDSSLGAVGSVLYYSHAPERVQAWGGGYVNIWLGTSHHFHAPVPWNQLDFLTAASVLIPAKVLLQVGFFDEGFFMYWEDTDLSFRIRAAGWKLGVAQTTHILHKEGASTNSQGPGLDYHVSVSGIRFMRKFAAIPAIPIFNLIVSRAAKRALLLQWKNAWAILSALSRET